MNMKGVISWRFPLEISPFLPPIAVLMLRSPSCQSHAPSLAATSEGQNMQGSSRRAEMLGAPHLARGWQLLAYAWGFGSRSRPHLQLNLRGQN